MAQDFVHGRDYQNTQFINIGNALRDDFDSLLSNFSGVLAPNNPGDGQLWYDTSNTDKVLKQYDSSKQQWIEVDWNTVLGKDMRLARGTKDSLWERLEVALNPDGSLKAGQSENLTEWIDTALTPTFISNNEFEVSGDQRDIFIKNRKIKATFDTSSSYSAVKTIDYDSINETTSVTLINDILNSNLQKIEYGLITPGNISSLPIEDRFKDILTEGVLFGGAVTENGTPDLSIIVESLIGYNQDWQRINLASQQTVDLSSYLPTTAGNEKYVSLYIDVIDLETNTEINIVEGTSAVAGSATKPNIDSAQGILLADVLLAEGQTTILNSDIEEVRKQKINLKNIAGQTDYVNVKDFGAKGDGVTDDTEAIQNAVNRVNNIKGILIFPFVNENYICKGQLTIADGVNVIGNNTNINFELSDNKNGFRLEGKNIKLSGFNIKIINTSAGISGFNHCPIIIDGRYKLSENITINNIYINGGYENMNGLVVAGNSKSIDIYNIFVEGNETTNTLGRGIMLHWEENQENIVLHPRKIKLKNINVKNNLNNTAEVNQAGIHISGCYDISLENINVKNCVFGIKLYAGDLGEEFTEDKHLGKIQKNIKLENIDLEVEKDGIALINDYNGTNSHTVSGALTSQVKISNGLLENTSGNFQGNGITAGYESNLSIDNVFIHKFEYGFNAIKPYLKNFEILNSKISDVGSEGIYLLNSEGNCKNILIDNVKILKTNQTDTGKYGIRSGYANENITIRNCVFGDNSFTELMKSAIRISSSNKMVKIINNTIIKIGGSVAFSYGFASDGYEIDILHNNNQLNSGITEISGGIPYKINNNRKQFLGSSTPTSGTFEVGDIIYNNNASANGHIGWVCVTTGTPGTWKKFGNIET